MPTLLHIDSSALYGRSVSCELTAAFVTEWKASHSDGRALIAELEQADEHVIGTPTHNFGVPSVLLWIDQNLEKLG